MTPPKAYDGEPRERRAVNVSEPVTLLKNGRLLTGYIKSTVQVWVPVVAFFAGITAIVGGATVAYRITGESMVRDTVKEEIQPLVKRMDESDAERRRQIIAAEAVHRELVTRAEIEKRLDEIKERQDEGMHLLRTLLAAQLEVGGRAVTARPPAGEKPK